MPEVRVGEHLGTGTVAAWTGVAGPKCSHTHPKPLKKVARYN